jgi:hypothetical protein
MPVRRVPMPDVVVLVPGILGSVLVKDGRDVWAPSVSALADALSTLGGHLDTLVLSGDDPDRDDLGDGVSADRLMPDVHLVPYFWKIDGYTAIASTLSARFDLRAGENFFEFAYDWRRDARAAARRLARESHAWLRAWRSRSGHADARLVILAHSLGGLVARHFLEVQEGWRQTRMLVTFGTPYRGSLNALEMLANGLRKAFGLVDLSRLLRSLTSVYQLLPIYPCLDVGEGGLVRVAETDRLEHVVPARATDALHFHRQIAAAVEANRRDAEYLRHRYRFVPIVGTDQPTSQSARLTAGGRVEMLESHAGEDWDGDGTVPRVSGTPLELADEGGEVYAATRHASLQNGPAVLTHVAGVLARERIDFGRYRAWAAAPVKVALALEDLYGADEPVAVRVRAAEPPSPAMTGEVVSVDDNRRVASLRFPAGHEGWCPLEIPPLQPGVYRITVRARQVAAEVSDLFVVSRRRP